MPIHGAKTPKITRRDKRSKRVVLVKMAVDFGGFVGESGDVGLGFERMLWRDR